MLREWWRDIPKFSLAGGCALALALLALMFAWLRISDVSRVNCQQIELVKGEIRKVVGGSLQTLGRRGEPGYEYYVTHPDELARARAELAGELATFRARAC